MKTKLFKILALALSAVLLVVTTVLVTVAYLTSSAMVTNTFTVGNVGILMYETPVNENGIPSETIPAGEMKTASSNKYKLLPNTTYTKDPTIYITSGSAESYLFIKVRNDIASIEVAADDSEHSTIAEQLAANGWKALPGYTTAHNSTIYIYTDGADNVKIVGNNNVRQDIPVFETFSIKSDATSEQLALHTSSEVKVVAYAIQTAGFEEETDPVAAAWAAIQETYPGEVHN